MQPDNFDSLRPIQLFFEKQLRQTYQKSLHLFENFSSDRLHLEIKEITAQGRQQFALFAKSLFRPQDIIAEVRGSLISVQKLSQLSRDRKVRAERLPVLLYRDEQRRWVLAPQNITKYLFVNGSRVGITSQANCYLERHYNNKILLLASQIIVEGDQLVLHEESRRQFVYQTSNCE